MNEQAAGAAALGALLGGRTEVGIIRTRLPVCVVDCSSAYVTIASTLGIEDADPAHYRVHDVTARFRRWTERLAALPKDERIREVLRHKTWRRWGVTVATIHPRDAWLPSRHYLGSGEYVGVFAPLTVTDALLPYAWPDIATALIYGTGDDLDVVTVWQWTPIPTTDRSGIEFPNGVRVADEQGVFAAVRAARDAANDDAAHPWREQTYKGIGVTAAFGNAARYDRTRTNADRSQTIVDISGEPFTALASHLETRARTTFPALAACVTAGTRCVVALAETLLRDAGGEIMSVLTDCLLIPAQPDGGTSPCLGGPVVDNEGRAAVRLLDPKTIARILRRFDRLTPDGRSMFVFKYGTEHRVLDAVMYRRNGYILLDGDTGEIVHNSEVHLGGVYLDPSGNNDARLDDGRRQWVAEAMAAIIAADPGIGPMHELQLEPWGDRMAVSPFVVSSPAMATWFARGADVRPFDRAMIAHEHETLTRSGPYDARCGAPIASFDPNPERWGAVAWTRRDRRRIRPRAHQDDISYGSHTFIPRTITDVISEWRFGTEYGADPSDGQHNRTARGLLRRRAFIATIERAHRIGKESDQYLARETGLVIDPDEYQTIYIPATAPNVDGLPLALLRRAVQCLTELGHTDWPLPPSSRRYVLAGGVRGNNARILLGHVTDACRALLAEWHANEIAARSTQLVIERFAHDAEHHKTKRPCALPECTSPANGRSHYCTPQHQQLAAQRQRRNKTRNIHEETR